MGLTTKKNTAVATNRKEIKELIKWPYINLLLLTVKVRPEKSGTLAIAAIRGVNKSETNAVTTEPKATPITIPTARSTTFPLSKNCLNSFNMFLLLASNIYLYYTLPVG